MAERRAYRITGRVQGVGYRYFARGHARSLGLKGWVRNRSDGSVEVHAEGPAERLDALEALLRQGPPHGDVTGLDRLAPDAGETYGDFELRFG
jgi:acylphosphatase